jgi:hypothetical protein
MPAPGNSEGQAMLMSHKLAAAALVSTVALSSAALAEELTPFNLDFRPFVLGQPLNQNDFGQDNYFWGFGANLNNPSPGTFGNWIMLGMPQFNADDTGDVFEVAPGVITMGYFCGPAQGCVGNHTIFNFTSIGLASSTNDGTGGQIGFVFNHPDGSFDTSVVTLAPGITGSIFPSTSKT